MWWSGLTCEVRSMSLSFKELHGLRGQPLECRSRQKNLNSAEPWWLIWLERQFHDKLSMLKVEGSSPSVAFSFFKLTACLKKREFLSKNDSTQKCDTALNQKPQFSEGED